MSVPQPGSRLHGFHIESNTDLPEFKGTGVFARHERTGLELYHLHNDDEENLFSFIFKTPPKDNSGVAHIVEHAVLAGSKRFPIKDPFLVLLKGSLNTFLNAMTYPDKTVYPGASTVKKDYYNLMTVYGDAVFFPLLRKEIFHQEGVRLQQGEEGLEVSGVVFNEMQGNYSSAESIIGEWSYRGLFPDSSYGYDSGGEPPAIRDLSYEEFTRYHAQYYHPSNCRIFLYGNIPTEEQLAFIEEQFLASFDAPRAVDAEINAEPEWEAPRSITVDAPVGSDEESGATLLISWRMGTIKDPVYLLAWEVLAEILLGNPGSPLYKALVDSRLGEDLSPSCGLDSELRDLVFSAGLRGIDPEKREELNEVIFGILRSLAAEGIAEEILKAALARIDFRHREIKGGVPFGLRLMGRSLRGWLHGENPEATLRYQAVITELKRRIDERENFFAELIEQDLLTNPNRVEVTVRPDESYYRRREEDQQVWLDAKEDALGDTGLSEVQRDYDAMSAFQTAPDAPDELAKIPCVAKSDLPKEIRRLTLEESRIGTVPFYHHAAFTNGIAYLDVAVDISGLSEEEYLLLPIFSKLLCNTGYPGVSYDRVATLLSRHSGGFYSFLEASDRVANLEQPALFLFFRLKALEEEFPRAVEIVGNLLSSAILDDKQRMKEELFELRNDMRASIVSSGHSYASLRSSRAYSQVLDLEERWRGIDQFLYISGLTGDFDNKWRQLRDSMAALKERIFRRNRVSLNLTSRADFRGRAEPVMTAFLDQFGEPVEESGGLSLIREAPAPYQALIAPSKVNFAALSFPAERIGSAGHVYEVLAAHILKVESLWEKIRMQGGAYGAFATVNATEGVFSMASYRDPHTHRTLNAFKESLAELAAGVDSGLLEKAIISVVGRELKPHAPGEEGMLALRRKLYGISDDLRQTKRELLLSATPAAVAAAVEGLIASMRNEGSAVLLGSDEALKDAAQVIPGFDENRLTLPL